VRTVSDQARDRSELRADVSTEAQAASRYRAIVDMDEDGIVMIDAGGVIVSMNPAAARMFKYQPVDVLGRDVTLLMPAPWSEMHRAWVAGFVDSGEAHSQGGSREVRGRRSDGSTFPLRLTLGAFRDAEGPMLAAWLHDLTPDKEREAALGRLQQMISESSDLMAFIDRDLRVRAVNDAYAAVFGTRPGEMVGRPIEEVVGEVVVAEYLRAKLEAGLSGTLVRAERWYESPTGQRLYLDVRYAPHHGADGSVTGVVIDARDRTELRQLEEEVDRRRAETAHIARLSTLGELASGLAHELNQPLSAIVGYCAGARRLVERRKAGPELLAETLDSCAGQARRAGEIIRRMRSLVRRERGERSMVDLGVLVDEVVALLEGEARRTRVQVKVRVGFGLPPVRVDRIQIEQVILNLVGNAIEAIDGVPTDRRQVVVRTRRVPGGGVEVQVQDTGPGFSPEAPLFEPFYTTKVDGMGLGLSICRSIADAHGATLSAETVRGGGALLRFALPSDAEGG
jgi:two-component system sensor kinase FixL